MTLKYFINLITIIIIKKKKMLSLKFIFALIITIHLVYGLHNKNKNYEISNPKKTLDCTNLCLANTYEINNNQLKLENHNSSNPVTHGGSLYIVLVGVPVFWYVLYSACTIGSYKGPWLHYDFKNN